MLLSLTAYRDVTHMRYIDDLPSHLGEGGRPYLLEVSADAIFKISECRVEERVPFVREILLENFYVLTLVGGEEHRIDQKSRDAIHNAHRG